MTQPPGFWSRPTTLKNITIREVSLVDKGANPDARITLFKRDDRATPEHKEKQMSSSSEIVALAKRINAGESGNYRSKAEWYRVTKAISEEQRQAGESSEQSFSRFVTATDDGKELYKAMRSADGPEFTPPPKPVLVAKSDTAYAKLKKLASDLRVEQPELTEHQAFARAFSDPANRELAELSKRENVFA